MTPVFKITNRIARRATIARCLTPLELEGLLADSLSPTERARLEAHLTECESCRKALREKSSENHLFQDLQQAYAESSTVPQHRDAERPSTALTHDSIEGYEVLSEIHRGGQGVVYKAVQQATKRTVALKVLLEGPYASAKQRHRFEREIDLIASLQHPNIVTVYESGVTRDRRHYFAMEYIDGQPLDVYLTGQALPLGPPMRKGKRAGFTVDETLRLFQRICAAVSYAHQRGVIHRDLKPGNIRIDAEGKPHVLDFGLAKAAGSDLQGAAQVTMTGEFMGTLAYASPEQTKGDPHLIDIRTDVYSLGVVLYEMLTGNYPYEVMGQMADVLRNIAEAEPNKPSTIRRQINDEVETIILKALAKDRERRYQSAETLARDIEHYLNGEPIDAKRDSTWYVIRKSMQRHRVAAGVALAFVLLLGVSTVALSIMYQNQSRAREEAELALDAADQARTSEEQQRKLAEKHANELQTVTEFQQSMLDGIDAAKMGRGIIDDLREGIRRGLEEKGTAPMEIESSIESLDQLLGEINATNLALNVVDEAVLTREVEAIRENFADQPLIRAALQQAVVETYAAIGLYEPALRLQKESLRTNRSAFGEDHPITLTSIENMGLLLTLMGKYKEAEPHIRKALEGNRRILGDDHPDTLVSIKDMGEMLRATGNYEEALPYIREALEGSRRVLGNDHPRTLDMVTSMGVILQLIERNDEALLYYTEAMESRRRVLDADDPSTLASISAMGAILNSMGKYEEALPYYREALEGRRRVLGDSHPSTLSTIAKMGILFKTMGRYDEALPYYQRALEGFRRIHEDDHPETLMLVNNMGLLLHTQGKFIEAKKHYSEAMEGRRRVLGDDHPATLISIHNMGRVLCDLGQLEEAERLGAEAIRGAAVKFSRTHSFRLAASGAYGRTLARLHRYSKAEKHLLVAHEGFVTTLGPKHERTINVINNLVDLYDAWHAAEPDTGYAAKASEWRAKLPQLVGEAEAAKR